MTSSVGDNPAFTADSNGFINVAATSEEDAINKGIVADATATTADHTQYHFGNGSNSPQFSVARSETNDFLNYNLFLANNGFNGFAKIQVHPLIDINQPNSFTVSDVNNHNNKVSQTDNTLAPLLAVLDPATGYATIKVDGILSANEAPRRAEALWTLRSDGLISTEIAAQVTSESQTASGTLAQTDANQVIHLRPGLYNNFILQFGFDLNGNGYLDGSAEWQRSVNVRVVQLASLNVDASAGTISASAKSVDTTTQTLEIEPADQQVSLKLTPIVLPPAQPDSTLPLTVYKVTDADGATVAAGNFAAGPSTILLPLSFPNYLFHVLAGIDVNGDGALAAGETTRQVDVKVVHVRSLSVTGGALSNSVTADDAQVKDLYVETDPVTGLAQIRIDGEIAPDDRESRSEALWRVTSGSGSATPATGSLLNGSTDVTLQPGKTNDFVVALGIDMNQNGQLDDSEIRRKVNVHPVKFSSLTVSDPTVVGDSVTVTNGSSGKLLIELPATGPAIIQLNPTVTLDNADIRSHLVWSVSGSGASPGAGIFKIGTGTRVQLTPGDTEYALAAAFDTNNNGIMDETPEFNVIVTVARVNGLIVTA